MLDIELPVSLGEAIDKLTILDIKCDKITDIRKLDVQKEHDILFQKLKDFIETYKELYNLMKKINSIIWEQMDKLRDGNLNDIEYTKLCRECIESNDIRFRVKNKINLISNSSIKEQKSYKINRLIIELKCDENIMHLFINPIKNLSVIYDEIIINSSRDLKILKDVFYYDNTIKYNIENNEFNKKYDFIKNNYNIDEINKILDINTLFN
jgi:hypothetical protein